MKNLVIKITLKELFVLIQVLENELSKVRSRITDLEIKELEYKMSYKEYSSKENHYHQEKWFNELIDLKKKRDGLNGVIEKTEESIIHQFEKDRDE